MDLSPLILRFSSTLLREDEHFLALVKPLFQGIDHGSIAAATSGLTLMEVLVVPYRTGNLAVADRYEALLTRSRGLRFIDIDRTLLKAAAQLRAAFNSSPPTRFR